MELEENLKDMFLSSETVVKFHPALSTTLQTEASDLAMGAVLTHIRVEAGEQVENGSRRKP